MKGNQSYLRGNLRRGSVERGETSKFRAPGLSPTVSGLGDMGMILLTSNVGGPYYEDFVLEG